MPMTRSEHEPDARQEVGPRDEQPVEPRRRRKVICVVGPGEGATSTQLSWGLELGRLIASHGWVALTGGRAAGVMDAVSRGARELGGLTVGVLPSGDRTGLSAAVEIAIVTGLGSARNNGPRILSCDVCTSNAGSVSASSPSGSR